MPRRFDPSETDFTATAGTLSNSNADQGVSFPTWGDPERKKITQVAAMANQLQAMKGF